MKKRTSVYLSVTCSACGENVPAGQFCINCGKKFSKGAVVKNKVPCPHCGRAVPEGTYCAVCGNELPAQNQAQDEANRFVELVEGDYFPFSEEEKTVLLYLLSKEKIKNKEIVCEASRKEICALFDIPVGNTQLLKEKLNGLYKHAMFAYRLKNKSGWVCWLETVRINERTVRIGIPCHLIENVFACIAEEKEQQEGAV